MRIKSFSPFAALILATFYSQAFAHHSTSANFLEDRMVEIEGTITSVRLRNPHVRFTMSVVNDLGAEVEWLVETNSLSGLRRLDVSTDEFAVGRELRIAGHPGRQRNTSIWATNMLVADGREVLVDSGANPRWSKDESIMSGPIFATEGDGSQPELGIFRVWSHTRATNMLFPETVVPNFDVTTYPLTEAARASVEAFDPVLQNPTRNCAPKGMPIIMEQPYPMQIADEDGNIVLYMEEYDAVRTIHMNQDATPAGTPGGLHGYSTGRWEGNALLVHTDHLNWGWFDQAGIPLGEDAVVDERFTLAEDGSRLDYTTTITAPSTFTEPVSLSKFWLFVPGVEVKPFDCAKD
ncbi:MAG: DUF6152 family protein [Woeseiaceae bacterium]